MLHITPNFLQPLSKVPLDVLIAFENINFLILQNETILQHKFQGFKRFLYTPMEAGEVMASCEARLLKAKTISRPFTAKEIAEGALWEHLTQEDYDAPLKVKIFKLFNFQKMFCSHLLPLIPMIITHIFPHKIFRDEPDCQPKLMPLRPQPESSYPSSLRKFLWKSGRPEKE